MHHPELLRLLPDADYAFQLGLRTGDAAAFFRPTPHHELLVNERRRWLTQDPGRYAAALPGSEHALHQAASFGIATNSLPASLLDVPSALDLCVGIGCEWEPDFLLLQPNTPGELRVVAAAVCFPSAWSLQEKIGQPMLEIHNPVPGLNASIGRQIGAALEKLHPGKAWLRSNWGLSASPELNQHPARGLPRLPAHPDPAQVWLRVEHQALLGLEPRLVLFGIRIANYPFSELRKDRDISARLARALETMPDAVASYKGLAHSRPGLIQSLRQAQP